MAQISKHAPARQTLYTVFCMVWAAINGMSVPLGMVLTIMLNSEADKVDQKYHAFYVTNLAGAVAGIELLPLAVRAEKPATSPKRWWHLAGGVCSLPAFFTTTAGSLLGSQTVLIVQLAGLLTTFFLIDLVDGRVRLTDYAKFLALLIIFVGIVLEGADQGDSMSEGVDAIVMLALVAVSGMGFALQSKCNSALAEDVGSAPRASLVSLCVNVLFSVPINLYIYFGCNVSASFDSSSWKLWLAAGFQCAFYIGSMAYLPKVLGFTRCYVIVLVAKMVTSLAIDARGLTGEVIPLSVTRLFALVVVLVGAVLFNSSNEKACCKTVSYVSIDQEMKEDL